MRGDVEAHWLVGEDLLEEGEIAVGKEDKAEEATAVEGMTMRTVKAEMAPSAMTVIVTESRTIREAIRTTMTTMDPTPSTNLRILASEAHHSQKLLD